MEIENTIKTKRDIYLTNGWVLLGVFFFVLQILRFHTAAYALEVLLIISYPVFCWLIRKNTHLLLQFFSIGLFLELLWIVALLNPFVRKKEHLLVILGGLMFGAGICLCLKPLYDAYCKNIKREKVAIWLKENWGVTLIIVVFWLLSLETLHNYPVGDEAGYYECIRKLSCTFDYTFANIQDFLMWSHISLSYALLSLLVECIFPLTTVGVHLMQITISVVSIWYFYKLLKKIYATNGQGAILIATTIYGFSPFILGTVGLINLDTFSICFFVFILYHYVSNNKVWELLSIVGFLFLKEPNAMYFLFMCLGILAAELVTKEAEIQGFLIRIGNVLKGYIPEVVLCVFWLVSFLGMGSSGWAMNAYEEESSVHRLGFTLDNFWGKTAQIFVLNFNWVIVLLIIVSFVCFMKKRKKMSILVKKIRIIYLATLCGVLFLNYVYIDYLTPRYIALGNELVIFLFIDVAFGYLNRKTFVSFSAVVAVLLSVQSFVSIDPLTSFLVYGVKPTKPYEGVMGYSFSNAYAYNREYSYYNKALERALKEVNYSGNEPIVMKQWAITNLSIYNWDIVNHRLSTVENESTVKINRVPEEYLEGDELILCIYPYNYELEIENNHIVPYRSVAIKYDYR